ncbi:MAG TPA: M28 family peptidase [Bacteroidota bacterium]|nr:M28 family peptidase [Bacteroidota bacterium]
MRFRPALFLFLLWPLSSHGQYSAERAVQFVRHLAVEIGPRPMGSPSEHRALEYAVSQFKAAGCDTAYIMPFERTSKVNTSSGIAVGIKRGSSTRIILIGGHIDSAGPEVPGADDDGSGAAVVMELAGELGRKPMRSTLVFCCFGGEEQGLEGSKYFASAFSGIDSVDLMLQADMANGLGRIEIDPDRHGASAPSWLVSAAIQEFYNLGYDHLGYPTHFFSENYAFKQGSGSDHEPFLERGIPAVDVSTDIGKPIHTPRDNFENYDAAGLKRTSELFARLVDRFDSGVPARRTEQYWLYLVFHTPIFIPLWAVVGFAVLAIALAAAAFVPVRRRREPPDSPLRVRWSGIKIALASLIIAVCGWLSSDVIALIRGIRHPWLTSIPLYYVLAIPSVAIGAWLTVRLLRKLRVSLCPYVYFKRSAILLALPIVVLAVASLASGTFYLKLAVEPAVALFLISLSAFVRKPILKLCLVALSPWWLFRLIFSEWDDLVFRSIASAIPSSPGSWLIFNGLMIGWLSVTLLPFLYALSFIIRDSRELKPLVSIIGSKAALFISVVLFICMAGYLTAIPVYNQWWYRDVRINERCDLSRHTRAVALQGSEYLRGMKIAHAGTDTSIGSTITELDFPPGPEFDTTWLSVGRSERHEKSGDTTRYDVELRLAATRRSYTVSVTYSTAGQNVGGFESPFYSYTNKGGTHLEWYSFPDSVLTIPVRFSVVGRDTVRENIEVMFDGLADPVTVEGEMTYVIPRTVFSSTGRYGS